ncbi:hypothetical protein OESDEN_02985 [Oesophagostomum dentatum]|uniref:Uncharacterized protein n=1 Tax=Oesophagostomum dentatum TaxID=61180 RepID=A0A0B1TIG2_OESDE|nr:hypothetical protein OESDEN_02985 [Oesophagostomum dentatum]
MIGIVSAIFTVFALFQTLFSADRESISMTVFEVLYLALESICIALLFVAVLKDKKMFLIPFFLAQVCSLFRR